MMGCHGLSPLARGTREFQDFSSLFPRFIPAGAGNTHSSGNTDNVGTVYPRWRGEHMRGWMHGSVRCGLSPLARGTQSRAALDYQYGRFIPAGAGNTGIPLDPRPRSAVYPRWRGEHPTSWRICTGGAGLSPLARGTLRPRYATRTGYRFIPAGAGNTPGWPARG